MLAISNTVSVCQLLLVCGLLAVLYGLRPQAGAVGLGRFVRPGLGSLLVGLVIAPQFFPIEGTCREARNHRIAFTAARVADKELPKATCLIVLDGSSVFTYGVDVETLRKQFIAAGQRPCILPLSIAGGDHFERESMAEETWRLMDDKSRQIAAQIPTLWVKELHWSYDSQPGRMVADNADTDRSLAVCDPMRAWRMSKAMVSNWREQQTNQSAHDDDEDPPWPGLAVVARQGLFNFFHVGYVKRLAEEDANVVKAIDDRLPTEGPRDWWERRSALDRTFDDVRPVGTRAWFADLLSRTPSDWPANPRRQMILVIAPSLSFAENLYAVQLEREGAYGFQGPLLLGPRDQALRQQLEHKELWRDAVHLEEPGAVIATRWLADKLLAHLPKTTPAP